MAPAATRIKAVNNVPAKGAEGSAAATGGLASAIVAVVVRPGLWITAVRQVFVLAPPGWWHRWPFLPLPDRGYLAFRLQTAYGSSDAPLQPHDVVTYLHWCRAWPRVTGRAR